MGKQMGKNDVINVACKLGRLVQGGVVGYYAGGKTSEMMSSNLPDQIVAVVEKHKKYQLGASLAQSFVPGAGVAAMAVAVASIWKMYYDINQVLGIKISENAGKSLTSAIVTNLASFGAKGVATAVSEGVKFIPVVGWLASAAISTASTAAIIYGSAYLYLNGLTKMYEVEGSFDLDYLMSEFRSDSSNSSYEEGNDDHIPISAEVVNRIKDIIAEELNYDVGNIKSTDRFVDSEDYDEDIDDGDVLVIDELDKYKISGALEAEFGISITKDADDFTFVDDFIECVTGESIWEKDDEYNDENTDVDCDSDDTADRFKAFFKSYCNGEYENWEVTKLAKMFECEAEECPSEGIKAQYYCLAAVVRTEYFIAECFDNQFKNYSGEDQYVSLLQKCICDGLDDIEKSLELVPKDKEYLLINGILSMLNDFYVETKNDKETFVDKYVKLLEDCRDCDNCMFNMEWLAELYMKVYNSIIEMFDKGASEEATSSTNSEAEQEYINELKDILADGEISSRERRLLDKIRQKLGITEERAKELEASLSEPQLTEDEQEYLDMFHEYAEKGEVTEKERRRLDKFAAAIGISTERVKKIEKLA